MVAGLSTPVAVFYPVLSQTRWLRLLRGVGDAGSLKSERPAEQDFRPAGYGFCRSQNVRHRRCRKSSVLFEHPSCSCSTQCTELNSPHSSRSSLYQEAIRATLIGLVVNVTLGIVKLVGGIYGGSFALISDAVNSIGDALTSLVVAVALVFAQRPADREHPYGHTRAEAIAACNVALLIILSALLVGWEAVRRIPVQHELPPVWTLWMAGANVLIKEGLFRYKFRVGKRTGSTAVIANAWDHRSDALCSLAVLSGLGVVRLVGPAGIWADKAAALIVVMVILWSGIRIFHRSASELMDLQASDEFVGKIQKAARSVAGVRNVETLWVRKSGLEYFADIHIEVDAHLTVDEGHRIGHQAKDRLLAQFPTLRDVLVHLEPYPHTHGGLDAVDASETIG